MKKHEAFDAAISLLKQMIRIPSVSRDEKGVADMLQSYMETSSKLPVYRHGNNLWMIAPEYEAQKPTLLLNAHIDTVRPVESWKRPPFEPVEEGDRIYGLGANDDGASLVSLLHVFLLACQENLSCNLVFLASCEEEVSGKNGIESVLPLLPKIDVALVGEPMGMRLAIAEKGLVVLDGVAHGKSGHAARNEGVNALYLACDAIQKLRDFRFDRESETLGPVKITVTGIQAGTVHNVIPDTCTFMVDCRTTDAYSNEEVVEKLRQLVGSEIELTPRSTRLQPSGIAMEHPLVQRIIELRPDVEVFGSPTLSDQALMHFPSLKMGPGESSRSHTADEFIEKKEISEAIDIYYNLITTLKWEPRKN